MNLRKTALLMVGLFPLTLTAQPAPSAPSAAPPRPPGAQSPAPAPQSQPPGGVMQRPGMLSAPPQSTEMPPKDKLSYMLGMYFGNNITNSLTRGEIQVDTNAMLAAVADVVNGKPLKMTQKEYTDTFNQLRGALMAKRRADEEAAKAKSEAFMANFAKGPGVIVLSNGLEYKVIKDGTGPMPKETDSVTVAYRGSLPDGTEFDKNDSFPTPIRGRIIQGWQKILPLMKVGSKWTVAIPPNLGYGARGFPPKIPANSALLFDIELKSVTPGAPRLPPLSANQTAATRPNNPQSSSPVVSGEIIKVPSADELKHGAKIEVIKSGQTNAVNTSQ